MRERGRGSPVEAGGSARRIAESSAKVLLGLSALGVSLPMTAAGQTTLPSSSAPVYLQSFPSGNPFTINLGTTLTGGFANGAVSGNASSPWIITNNGTVTAGSSGTGVVTSGNSSVTTTARSGPPDPEAKLRLMEEIVSRENMMAAHHRVKANKGAAGIDRMTVEQLTHHSCSRGFRPLPLERV